MCPFGLFSPRHRPFLRPRAIASLYSEAPANGKHYAPCPARWRPNSQLGARLEAECDHLAFFRHAIAPSCAHALLLASRTRLQRMASITHPVPRAGGPTRSRELAYRQNVTVNPLSATPSALPAHTRIKAGPAAAHTCPTLHPTLQRSLLRQHASGRGTCSAQSG
jgi:hypothetical protein